MRTLARPAYVGSVGRTRRRTERCPRQNRLVCVRAKSEGTMTTRERLGIDGRCRRKLWTPESWPGPMWKSTTNDFWENLHHCGESVRRNRRWSSSVRTVCVPTVCMRAGDLVSMTGGMRTARLAAFASHYLDSGATLRGRVVRVTCKPDRHGEHKVASTQKASGLWRQVRFSMRLI